jgi:hypothetical protein
MTAEMSLLVRRMTLGLGHGSSVISPGI